MTRAPTPARPSPHYRPPKPRAAPKPTAPPPMEFPLPLDLVDLEKIEVSIPVISEAFHIHSDVFRNHLKQGIFHKSRPGHVMLVEAMRGVVVLLKQKATAITATGSRDKVAVARAAEINQRIEEKSRALVPIADAQLAIDLVCRAVKDQMTGLAARTTRDPVLQRQIAAEVNASLLRITNSLTASAKLLRTGEVPGGWDAHD